MIKLLDYQFDIIKVLVIFYLLIYSAQIDSIFKCLKINRITDNLVIQYIIIFFIFFFLVSSITNTKKLMNIEPIQKLIYSFFYFILFILTLRIHTYIRNAILILLIVCYFIDMNHDHYYRVLKENNNKKYYWITWKYPVVNMYPVNLHQVKMLSNINKRLLYIIYFLFFIGIVIYIKEIQTLMRKKVSLYKIIFYNFCNGK